jgi:hypothetical protein
MTGAALAFLLLAAFGCTESTADFRGIQTRIYVDRTEARVGDLLGVTIEIDTPGGFAVEAPAAPPSDERFVTDRVEKLRPVEIPGGVRHRVLWSLRPRTVGDHRLPELSVPLAWPDGTIQRLPVGSIPIPVRSVRAELPDRDVYFDIEKPPPVPSRPVWPWVTAAGAFVAGITALLLYRRRSTREIETHLEPALLAHEALAELDAALAENDPRALATRLTGILRTFVERRWSVEGEAWTPEEIPPEVDARVTIALRQLDGVRFARTSLRAKVLEGVRVAQTYLADVARRR